MKKTTPGRYTSAISAAIAYAAVPAIDDSNRKKRLMPHLNPTNRGSARGKAKKVS